MRTKLIRAILFAGAFAYPAINVTSSQTLNAALQGFAEAESDGILQVSTGGADYLSGPAQDMALGEGTKDLASKHGISQARISQLRRELHSDWRRFHGEIA